MRILRNVNKIVEEFRTRLQALTESLNYIRGKVEHISDLMTVARGGVSELVKKVVAKKTKEWVDEGTERFNETAKEAVDKAVEETAKKMRKTAAKIRK